MATWMAYDRGSGDLVGRGGLSRTRVIGEDRLEAGWALHRRFWGLGYAKEIGQAAIAFAFDELGADGIVSYTETRNMRSRAVMSDWASNSHASFSARTAHLLEHTCRHQRRRGASVEAAVAAGNGRVFGCGLR